MMSFLLCFFVFYFTIFNVTMGTNERTLEPTSQPTNVPSWDTYDASSIDVRNAISGQLTEFFENEDNIYYCIFIIFGICTSLAIVGSIHRYSKCPVFGKYGDSDDVSVFFLVAVRIADFVTDILFILYIYQYRETLSMDNGIFILAILFYWSIGTIIVAFILNIVFTYRIFSYGNWFNKERVLCYLDKNLNKNIFTLISVFTLDVILALHVTKSKFLGLYMFDSGVTSHEITYEFGYVKLISITIFENIPSLMIQILFTLNYEFTILSVVSIIFSGYSIVVSIMNHCMINASSKSGTPTSYSITFGIDVEEEVFEELIKPKLGLHSALQTKIRSKIGTLQNDLEIGCIDHDNVPLKTGYNVRVHCLSKIHDKFKWNEATLKKVSLYI